MAEGSPLGLFTPHITSVMWGYRPHTRIKRGCYSKIPRQVCCRALQTEYFRVWDQSPELWGRTVPGKKKVPHVQQWWMSLIIQQKVRPRQQAVNWLLCPPMMASGQLLTAAGGWGAMQFLLISCSETQICRISKIPAFLLTSGCYIGSGKVLSLPLAT